MQWLKGLTALTQRVYMGKPIYIRMDREQGLIDESLELLNELSLTYESTPKHTKEPSGLIEQARGILSIRA
jgi:hypothetical protein